MLNPDKINSELQNIINRLTSLANSEGNLLLKKEVTINTSQTLGINSGAESVLPEDFADRHKGNIVHKLQTSLLDGHLSYHLQLGNICFRDKFNEWCDLIFDLESSSPNEEQQTVITAAKEKTFACMKKHIESGFLPPIWTISRVKSLDERLAFLGKKREDLRSESTPQGLLDQWEGFSKKSLQKSMYFGRVMRDEAYAFHKNKSIVVSDLVREQMSNSGITGKTFDELILQTNKDGIEWAAINRTIKFVAAVEDSLSKDENIQLDQLCDMFIEADDGLYDEATLFRSMDILRLHWVNYQDLIDNWCGSINDIFIRRIATHLF